MFCDGHKPTALRRKLSSNEREVRLRPCQLCFSQHRNGVKQDDVTESSYLHNLVYCLKQNRLKVKGRTVSLPKHNTLDIGLCWGNVSKNLRITNRGTNWNKWSDSRSGHFNSGEISMPRYIYIYAMAKEKQFQPCRESNPARSAYTKTVYGLNSTGWRRINTLYDDFFRLLQFKRNKICFRKWHTLCLSLLLTSEPMRNLL